ncbi:DHHW family protein [Faecalicatena contorta]|uniref:DHHW protein n=1 Tax=Faecalicatena contorta TaxID=39482 RepID=A0A316A1W9_9FIRM|nr:DHHW family protein [Faecalicatena contorta]PWJ51542.1 DHHW motif protein [Faecalicatena contorta]SUQ13098.1 DHHW protein [Faecalicatena contorta]
MRKNRKKRWVESFIGKVFIICLLVFTIGNFLVPNQKKSEEENRMLAPKPKLTFSSLISGSYMQQFERYQSDQFLGRGGWRKLKVTLNRLGGSREENGVFIGKKGQLLEDIAVPDREALESSVTAMKEFAENYSDIPVSVLLVPDAANVIRSSLPSLAEVADQNVSIAQLKKELGNSVQWIDGVQALNEHKNERIYYKTDPHWTSLGAFYVFEEAAGILGITTDFSSGYASYPITTDFNGALASRSGCEMNVKEEISIYVPKDTDNDVVVNYVDEQKKTTSLYDLEMLHTRDKYGVFLSGNTSVVDIKTMAESRKKLLIVRDSYANCFVPFLTPYFQEIVLVDPRYYSGTVQDIMETYQITDVLFLYSGNSFFQDNNINGVLSSE